ARARDTGAARRVPLARCRRYVGGADERAAAGERVPRRPARRSERRFAPRAWHLLRDDDGPGLREPRRRRELERGRDTPPGDRLRRGLRTGGLRMAEIHLPTTLLPLFPGLERRIDVPAATAGEAIDVLDERFPGLRDRLCEPGPVLRSHIHIY